MKAFATFSACAIALLVIAGPSSAEGPLDELFQATTGQPFTPPGYVPPNSDSAPTAIRPARKRAASPSRTRSAPRPQTKPTETAKAVRLPPGNTASQTDWDECAGKDLARVIAACSRIVPNPDETVQDRTDAYLFRAGAYLAQGDLDHAIADYSDAIVLNPRNVVAFSSRALAHSRKGDHERAVLDYNAAAKLDPKAAAEIAVGNAEIGAIARDAR